MKTCKLPTKPSASCEIELDGKALTEVLKRVDSVTGFSESIDKLTHIHMLVVHDKDVFIIGRTPDTFVAYHLEGAKGTKDSMFSIDPKQLQGLIAKRDKLIMSFDFNQSSDVTIEAVKGKYRAEYKTRQVSSEQIPMVNEGLRHHIEGGHSMSKEVIDRMTQGIRLTRLTDPYTSSPVICRVECTGDELKVTSPGNWTSSRYEAELEESVNPFRFSLSGGMFDLIYKFIDGDAVTFHADSASFAAESDNFVVTLPPIQSNDNDYRRVDDLYQNLGKPVVSATLQGDISAPFTNISSILDKKGKAAATIEFKKKDVRIEFANDSGRVSDALKSKNAMATAVKAKLDLRVMNVIMKNIAKEPEHVLGLHGASVKSLSAFSLTYSNKEYDLLYLGYLPS